MNPGRIEFYLLGREKPLSDMFDFEALAQRVLHGENPRDVARAAAADAAVQYKTDDARKKWARKKDIRDALEEINTVSEAEAFASYFDGAIDQTAFDMEPDILEAVDGLLEKDETWAVAEAVTPAS